MTSVVTSSLSAHSQRHARVLVTTRTNDVKQNAWKATSTTHRICSSRTVMSQINECGSARRWWSVSVVTVGCFNSSALIAAGAQSARPAAVLSRRQRGRQNYSLSRVHSHNDDKPAKCHVRTLADPSSMPPFLSFLSNGLQEVSDNSRQAIRRP